MLRPDDSKHTQTRSFLRILGPGIAVVGLIFMVIGVASFFMAFGGSGPPRFFWCAFIGMPILFVGIVISKFAYVGAVSRYMADEVAPVGKDVFNYMADGTKGSIRNVAAAVGEGLRSGIAGTEAQAVHCPKCNADNDASAKFCDACGAPLPKSKVCAGCGEQNDPDARFCDNCGKALD